MTPIGILILCAAVLVAFVLVYTGIRIDKTEERIKALEVREKAREAKQEG